MKKRHDRISRQDGWTIGGYPSDPIPLDELGLPPADWVSPVSKFRALDAVGTTPAVRRSSSSPGERSDGPVPGLDKISAAHRRAVSELATAQLELERFTAHAQLKAEALRRVLGYRSGYDLTFVVPTLEATDPIHRTVIASEDVRAFNRVRNDLGGIGLESSVTSLMGAEDVVSPDPRDLMLFCRDERNPMTREFLRLQPVGIDFIQVGNRPDGRAKWAIRRNGADLFASDSYDTEVAIESELDSAGDTRSAVLRCPAVVVRAPNPFNREGSHAVLLAGVRAFGTWGAAEYLCSEAETIMNQTNGRDFVALIDVEADALVRRCADDADEPRFSTVFERIRGWNCLDLWLLAASDDHRMNV